MIQPSPYLNDEGHLREDGVARYVDALRSGDLSTLPPDLLSHVEDCLACKKLVTGVFSVLMREDSRLQQRNASPPDDSRSEGNITTMIYRIAATIAALIGIGVIGYTLYTNYFSQPKTTAEVHQTATSTDSLAMRDSVRVRHAAELADAYVPSEELDELVGDEVRSSSITVASPKQGADVGESVTFAWSGGEKNQNRLSIMNNKGDVVAVLHVTGRSFVYRNALRAGLYYWKLDDGSNLLYVGKFFVGRGGEGREKGGKGEGE